MKKAIFFDRDGIVNIRIAGQYVKTADEFVFWNDFLVLFKKIKAAGYSAYVITNQQGIGKGLMSEKQLEQIHKHMQSELVRLTGYTFDGIYFCPDLANTGSKFRKPEPGMLFAAAGKHDIDLKKSLMIGDSASDAVAGKKAGCTTIFIGNEKPAPAEADYAFPHLASSGLLVLLRQSLGFGIEE